MVCGNVIIDGLAYKLDVKNMSAEIIPRYKKWHKKSVVIPSVVRYKNKIYNVTRIGERAFSNCVGLTSIIIPESVTSLGDMAIVGCSDLTTISVSPDNKVYDSRDNCNAIIETATNKLKVGCKNTIIPTNVTSISQWAFEGCDNLTSVIIPEGVEWIGHRAFYECRGLKSIAIPNSVKSIGNGVFCGCKNLRAVMLPAGVTTIGRAVFEDCENLTSISVSPDNKVYDSRDNCNAIIETATNTLIVGCKNTIIPRSVKGIGQEAFMLCRSLTSIVIPDGVTWIGNSAFSYCSSLKSVVIPKSVTNIGDFTFTHCNLTSVVLPESVTNIGKHAFYACSGLTSVTLNKQTVIGKEAFDGCPSELQFSYYEPSTNINTALCQGALPGVFTVSADGKKVRFSQGNLQYTRSTKTWSFAAHQYDMIGWDNVTGGAMVSSRLSRKSLGTGI